MANSLQRSIFLADDDRDDREIFSSALSLIDESIILSQVDDGLELFKILRNPSIPNPDLIFLDLNMPKCDGFECLEGIMADNTLRDIKVIMLSTSSHPSDISKAFEYGASLYIVKPGSFRTLQNLLSVILDEKNWTGKTFLNQCSLLNY